MRSFCIRFHRYAGLAMVGFLIIAGLTGSVLAFKSELDRWLNPRLFHVERAGRPLSPSRLAAAIERANPGIEIFTLVPSAKDGDSATAYVGSKTESSKLDYNQLFVDPANGAILGKRMSGAFRFDRAHFIPFLYRLHYTLTMPGNWGVWLMGGVALVWMLDCFVGFYLTLPRGRPFGKKWKAAWTVKRGAGPYRFNVDLHRAAGLWLWPLLFLLALSGAALNLNRELFRPILSTLLPTTDGIWERPVRARSPTMTLDWDAAVYRARAEATRRGWHRAVNLIYAARAQGIYMVRFGGDHDPGFGASNIYVFGVDGRILSVEDAGGGKAGDAVADLMFPIHSGQVAGLPGRILTCITGLVVAMLSITGVVIWSKKRDARSRRRSTYRRAQGFSHAAE